MGPVARAWLKAQDPALVRAIRHAFCEHSHAGGWRFCPCLTKRDRAVLSAWVERSVMRGYPNVVRVDRFGQVASARWGRPELMGADGHYHGLSEGPGCWFPFCPKAPEHTGLHSGIRQAGARLVELRTLAEEIAALPDSDVDRRAELVTLLVRLAGQTP